MDIIDYRNVEVRQEDMFVLGDVTFTVQEGDFVYLIGKVGSGKSSLFKTFYGLDAQSPFYYVPFYTPSAAVGAALGVAVLAGLKKAGVFEKLWHQVNP